ncbi:MAG: hypothetical protein AAF400_01555 [Bacteroidota bacterium]
MQQNQPRFLIFTTGHNNHNMDEKPLVSFDAAIKYLLQNKGDFQIIEGFISALLGAFGYSPVKIKAF